MKIVLASASALKIEACRKAFAGVAGAQIVPVKVPSGVAEQPVNGETLVGAFNRIQGARQAIPGADIYVSIENGLFEENGAYIDRAVVAMARGKADPIVTYSGGVEFPIAAVEETRRRGFGQWTAGRVMQALGIVRQHDDPHLDLSGKSRVTYIDDAMRDAVASLNLI